MCTINVKSAVDSYHSHISQDQVGGERRKLLLTSYAGHTSIGPSIKISLGRGTIKRTTITITVSKELRPAYVFATHSQRYLPTSLNGPLVGIERV